eukprot:TRINITY_DN1586_c0_g1_i1.p1 TRINITY_DN1586_c0_g1~~TRINITY_DN1586_c0_g1_i1.p1  ORF type:complete len:539 (-),score=113.74 TRINITY_DN1586_c0_g1_i1:331-1947(-)
MSLSKTSTAVQQSIESVLEPLNARLHKLTPWQLMLVTAALTYALPRIGEWHRMGWKTVIVKSLMAFVKVIPGASGLIQKEIGKVVEKMDEMVADEDPEHRFIRIPEKSLSADKVLEKMRFFQERDADYSAGQVSGCIYHGGEEHKKFLDEVYVAFSSSNLLHADIFKSTRKFEAEVVKMTAAMFNGDDGVCGTMTSGGTESILMAMKVYRDYAKKVRGVEYPELVFAVSAHAAFDKACHYFGIKAVKVEVGSDYRADVAAMAKAINRNTIAIVGSAPGFPHGVFDPIEELAALAASKGIGMHVDGCLGGFLFPWAQKLGYDIPVCDFRIPGVTSMSVDTHKYGYSQKGCSVVLYRNSELRRHQFFSVSDWSGGLYASPSMAGSRPGGLVATAWASIIHHGEEGFLHNAKLIMETSMKIADGIRKIPGLFLVGEPKLSIIAFGADGFDIFAVFNVLSEKGWHLNALHKPNCLHICCTLRHVGQEQRFLDDVAAAAEAVKNDPSLSKSGMAPIYGMAASLPERGIVSEILLDYVAVNYKA